MVIDKQTMQKARRVPDAHAHRAIQTALDNLDAQPAPRRRPRWVPTAAVAAAAVVLVVALAALPPLRYRAVSVALDALGRAVPQSDRVNPAGVASQPSPTARADSAFLRYPDVNPFYAQVAQIAQVVGVSETVNGVTATVEEAALTVDKLYLVVNLKNAPQSSDIWNEMRILIDGQSSAQAWGFSDSAYNDICAVLPSLIDRPGVTLPVHLTFDLTEHSDNGGKGEVLGSFALDFTVSMGDTLLQVEDPTGVHETAAPDAQATAAAVATAQAVPTVSTALADLPDKYPPEEAAANGDYVSVHGQISNADKMAAFLDAVSAKRSAAIRTVNYTVEGDPIIADIVFDGSKFTVKMDTTRDAFGEQKVTQSEYRNIREYEQDGATQVYLTNEDQITEALFKNGFDGYLLTTREDAPAAEATAKAEPTTADAEAQAEAQTTAAPPAQPQITVDAIQWTLQGAPMGDHHLSFAVPESLAQIDLSPEDVRSKPPTLQETLGDDIVPLQLYRGGHSENGLFNSIVVLAIDPGTASMGEITKRLELYWSHTETKTNTAGNEVAVFTGTTDKTPYTSTLLVYRLPEGTNIGGKPYPILVLLTIFDDEVADQWVAALLEHTSIQ